MTKALITYAYATYAVLFTNVPGFNAELKYPIQKTIVTRARGVAQASPHIDEILYLVCDKNSNKNKKNLLEKFHFWPYRFPPNPSVFLYFHSDHIFFSKINSFAMLIQCFQKV